MKVIRNKKIYIILIVIAIILMLVVKGISALNNNKSTKEKSNILEAEEKISSLLHSSEYSKMSDEEKKLACENLLIELKKEGIIEKYYYSDMAYTIEYKGGIHGMVMLKDWKENID